MLVISKFYHSCWRCTATAYLIQDGYRAYKVIQCPQSVSWVMKNSACHGGGVSCQTVSLTACSTAQGTLPSGNSESTSHDSCYSQYSTNYSPSICSDANIALVAMSAVMQQGAPSNPQNSGTSVQPLMTAAMSIAGSAISVDHMPAGFVTVESKGFY